MLLGLGNVAGPGEVVLDLRGGGVGPDGMLLGLGGERG